MECTWDAALLSRGDELTPELLEVIQYGNDAQYLNELTKASLDPRYTYILFAHCGDIFVHVCATLRSHGNLPSAIATLGRVVPFAPYLMNYAERLLSEDYSLGSTGDSNDDVLYLLGMFRLLSFDERTVKKFIQPNKIAALLETSSRPVIYLAIRILQIYCHGADHWFEQMVKRYLREDRPDNDINGQWDDRVIDYRFLSLWEADRFKRVSQLIKDAESSPQSTSGDQLRILPAGSFDDATALIGGILLPRGVDAAVPSRSAASTLIHTSTIDHNLREVALGLKTESPLLIEGSQGAGKTLLIRHVAQELGKLEDMVTLHLNQQSDAKLLIGIYTTGQTPGSFVWKPGVLTTAVREGRWVVIEDIDRAPNEIIGALLPLIEKGKLSIPNRKQTIHAAPGFRIIATVRTATNHRGESVSPISEMLGIRHWHRVQIESPSPAELQGITGQLHHSLSGLLPQFHATFERLQDAWQTSSAIRQNRAGSLRRISPNDLLKWCSRVSQLLQNIKSLTSNDMDDIFMEGVDCFIGALPENQVRADLAAYIAEELRIDPRRRDYLLSQRDVRYAVEDDRISIGRYHLSRSHRSKKSIAKQGSFSTNPHTVRMLEKVAGAVINREPLLLVGETGVGKTAAVQYLANHMDKKLVPFNLSQQSEAGDLLGGFKPVNARTLFVPMKDEFDELFTASFSISKNQQFLDLLGKQTSKSNWKAVCKLWQQALKMVDQQRASTPSRSGEAPSKKRKVESKKSIDFARWDNFAAKVTDLERRLASAGDSFAFSFVEGNIVMALRNGDWILLDEINLASTDTLESIADLLDTTSPSLLLTESGSVERIDAHPSFRVFAAMNPATDVGKKNLPPGIRSRFTELYVESPDKDIRSLSSIVQSYLRHVVAGDQAIPVDVSKLYQSILSLTTQNQLVDGAGSKPHFSLRTLTRTLSYAKCIAPYCSLRRALYEGFQMSFLTLLDSESVKLVQPLIEQGLFGKRTNVRAELQKALRKPSERHVLGYPGSKHWVRSGNAPIEEESHYILTPFIRNNLENLVRATSTRQFPVLIQGPTSSGKTSMIEYLAKRTGHKFVRINNHEHTDLQEYFGTYVSGADGRLQFQDGVLVKALQEGHWIVLDELNLAPTDVLEALNRLLDDNRELLIPETQEVIRPHEDFMLFATQNPAGLYGGRKVLSRAFRNRFLELHFDDIPVDELQEILHRRTQLPESRCKRIVNVYRELSVLRQENRLFEHKSFATLRDLFRWAQRPNDTIDHLAANGFMLLAERTRKDEDRRILKEIIEKAMSANGPRVKIDEGSLYSQECKELMHYERNTQDNSVVWTKAMRRLYVLVARALENNEPVLLVGETGCGKTTVCQMLADALGKKLHSVNAHQNTEIGDLVGSQRPIRNRAAIEAGLRHQLLSSELLQNLDNATDYTTDALVHSYEEAFASLSNDMKSSYAQTPQHLSIVSERTRFKALFEWIDGSLVQAMKEGAFFLLDEISLADDSVLERINSVLESQRSILLAEKGTIDSYISASPGFQFFATMNPGGDYGKRELSPALRNRFTEIWVPPLSDTDDVVQIVHEKLSPSAKTYAPAMVAFAQWFRDRHNTSATTAISIRDVLSWLSFVNASPTDHLSAALVHGAAMVYIDTLGANPAGLMTTNRTIDQSRNSCVDYLGQLFDFDAHSTYSSTPDVSFADSKFVVGPFSLSKASDSGVSSFSFDPPTTKTNAMRVVRALQLSKPIMLEGNPGVGKTALITAIAQAAGVPLTRINLSEQTDLIDLFGSDVPVEGAETGNFSWRDAPFLRAMKNGEWVLLDEMNLASQSVLEGLNACLDHRGEVYVPELGQTFSRHPEFKLFAAQNPHHHGGGRKGLPASFVNRFTVVYADAFRPTDLQLISHRSYPNVDIAVIDKVITFVDQLDYQVSHKRIGAHGSPWEFNYRDISRLLALATSDQGLLRAGNVRDFVDLLFLQRFRSAADKSFVEALFCQCFGHDLHTSDLSLSSSTENFQVGLGFLPRSPLTTETSALRPSSVSRVQHLRILQSAMLCVQQNWPVILTGRSGSGKTKLVEQLAAMVGVKLVTLTINSETDAMDLVGGFEQTDLKWHSDLSKQHSEETLKSAILARLTERSSFPHSLDQQLLANGDTDDSAQVTDKPKFEWIDGILVEAMLQGKWMVLDNANLCSPSVLDRLNSLLEPDGVLIMNERSNADGSPRIIKPHPNFRIFLTVNPRYGELSRAMRNRAVELHIPDDTTSGSCFSSLWSESAVARFQQASVGNPSGSEHVSLEKLAHVMFDHLSPSDEPLIGRAIAQFSAGLFDYPRVVIESMGNAYQSQSKVQIEAVKRSHLLYKDVTSQSQVPADFTSVQTLHPLNNQALAQIFQQATTLAPLYAFIYDHSIQLSSMSNLLQSIRSNSPLLTKINRLERSLGLKSSSPKPQANVAGILGLSSGMQNQLSKLLTSLLSQPSSNFDQIKRMFRRLASLNMALLETITQEKLDAANLNAVVSIGTSTVASHSPALAGAMALPLTTIHESFSTILGKQMHSNHLTCSALWKSLRPLTPRDGESLQGLLQLETVIARFDEIFRRFVLPIEKMVDLRISFTRTLELAHRFENNASNLASDIQSMLPQVHMDEASQSAPEPHFRSTFEALHEQLSTLNLAGRTLPLEDLAALDIFATHGTQEGQSYYSFHDRLSSGEKLYSLAPGLASLLQPRSTTSSSIESIGTTLFSQLMDTDDISLARLELLDAEIGCLGRTISSCFHLLGTSTCKSLDVCLKEVTEGIIRSLMNQSDDLGLRQSATMLLHQLEPRHEQSACISATLSNGQGSRFEALMLNLQSTIVYLHAEHNDLCTELNDASNAWARFACTCLELYIPNGAYDPALDAQLKLWMHYWQHDDLSTQLKALEHLRESLTGETDSLRARVLQDDIISLGPAPQADQIYRPKVSEFSELQLDLRGLMRALQPFYEARGQPASLLPLNPHLLSNIVKSRKRLSMQYRAYGDFTAPIIGFVDCLLVAHRLAENLQIKRGLQSPELSLTKIIPFANASVASWASDSVFLEADSSLRTTEEVLCWLSIVAVRSRTSTISTLGSTLLQAVERRFDQFYQRWQARLKAERRAVSEKSSLYRFRHQESELNDTSVEDLEELFPSNSAEHGHEPEGPSSQSGSEDAINVARMHLHVFLPREATDAGFLDLLKQWAISSSTRVRAMDFENSSSAVLIILDELRSKLRSQGMQGQMYNMYTDPNIGQTKKLVSLVKSLTQRFKDLQATWPEHATPVEVLRLCDDILGLPHTTALATLFPRLERLHTTVNDWQSIASREFSVYDLVGQLSDLIISWRQLELSSWAGLFDREWEQCQKMAASWWYVAYETIIAATATIEQSPKDLHRHTQDLLAVLGAFIDSSGLGEFSARLQMLRSFEAHLSINTAESPPFESVRQALANFNSFYKRFEAAVKNQLSEGRAALEKDIKNVLQLASWKDRNIDTLRQSAQSSHKKLLRLVKKFRMLLAQPVSPIIQRGVREDFVEAKLDATDRSIATTSSQQTSLGVLPTIIAWQERSARFRNADQTSTLMETKFQLLEDYLDAPDKLRAFRNEINEQINELQKSTPSASTDDNQALIRHLKTRKRRLLADVLKAMKRMGYQTSVSEQILREQDSVFEIFARLPTFPDKILPAEANTAECELHRLLCVMPTVRDSARKHSEDLSSSEAMRCTSLLESVLQTCVTSRMSLATHLDCFSTLKDSLDQFKALASSPELEISTSKEGRFDMGQIQTKSSHLRHAIHAAIHLLRTQERLSGNDYTDITTFLETSRTNLDTFLENATHSPHLPNGVRSRDSTALQNRQRDMEHEIRARVELLQSHHPETGPVLLQLLKWLPDRLPEPPSHAMNGHYPCNLTVWIEQLFSLVDSVLACVQDVDKISTPSQISGEDDWVKAQTIVLDKTLNTMHMRGVAQKIGSLLSLIQKFDISAEPTALSDASFITQALWPIFNVYEQSISRLLKLYCHLNAQCSNTGYCLATSFIEIANRGFCAPSENLKDKAGESGDVETGTGLGEGEGAEDISKDIGDEEDLSELAQDAKLEGQKADMSDEKDAVDMADEEMEGQVDDGDVASEVDEDASEKDDEKDAGLEEEAGSNDLDSGAVDEKMWDEGADNSEQEKEAESGKGSGKNDEVTAAEQPDDVDRENTPTDEAEAVNAEEQNQADEEQKLDPHVDEGDSLDLPDNMETSENHSDGEDSDAMSMPGNSADVMDTTADSPGRSEPSQDEDTVEHAADSQDEKGGEADQGTEDTETDDVGEGATPTPQLEVQEEHGLEESGSGAILGGENMESGADGDADESSQLQQQMEDNKEGQEGLENEENQGGTGKAANQQSSTSNNTKESPAEEILPYKKLGDVLDQWYNKHREVSDARQAEEQQEALPDSMDMQGVEFEHLPDENATSDAQALGGASAEQSVALNEDNAINEDDDARNQDNTSGQDDAFDHDTKEDEMKIDFAERIPQSALPKSMVGEQKNLDETQGDAPSPNEKSANPDDMDDVDERMTNAHISPGNEVADLSLSLEDAQKLWAKHEESTHNAALILTEHLRLILQPTQATKMRGDFRTGKRLNIKRIIPYIASSYKRDKIWMRRSTPTKRSYQIMLAIDDSKSMAESRSDELAFETLSLIAKSMSMLEVGELSVVGFGDGVKVAHDFNTPFNSEAGAHAFQQFTFSQSKTDVIKLLGQSISLFRTARSRASGSASDLWQLQLIISDGICDDHPKIRQLVREAHEERIMIVFIVVDFATTGGTGQGASKQSILDMQTAQFSKDDTGIPQLKMTKYLDTFPFSYYLIVQNIQELPDVLAGALRQWFAEVVDIGS